MFASKSVKISKELYQNIEKLIQGSNYESVPDFIEKYLSAEIRQKLEEKEVEDRLKGLGYVE